MMSFCKMSSNGFLNAPELSFRIFRGYGPTLRASRLRLGVNAAGGWYVRVSSGVQPVLLLRDSSFWLGGLAMLTLSFSDGSRHIVGARRDELNSFAWRRLRVWFYVG